jgi:hypothetical protein
MSNPAFFGDIGVCIGPGGGYGIDIPWEILLGNESFHWWKIRLADKASTTGILLEMP